MGPMTHKIVRHALSAYMEGVPLYPKQSPPNPHLLYQREIMLKGILCSTVLVHQRAIILHLRLGIEAFKNT